MTKIKNIYSFGTSFSNAGGFEFHRKSHMRDYYKCLDIPLEKSKVQYTYLLSQLLEKTINCTNLSKDGFGNERIYRKIHEITHQKNFIPEENLFIIEFSDLGRKEIYVNKDKKHGIINYLVEDEQKIKFVGSSYNYNDEIWTENLLEAEESFKSFFEKSFNFREEIDKTNANILKTITYLEYLKIPYIILHSPPNPGHGHVHIFDDLIKRKSVDEIDGHVIFGYLWSNKYDITDETNGKVGDLHFGYRGNIIISKLVFNKMIDLKLIEGEKIPFDDIIKETNNIKEILDKNN